MNNTPRNIVGTAGDVVDGRHLVERKAGEPIPPRCLAGPIPVDFRYETDEEYRARVSCERDRHPVATTKAANTAPS